MFHSSSYFVLRHVVRRRYAYEVKTDNFFCAMYTDVVFVTFLRF